MKNIKTKTLSIKAINHLIIDLKYKSEYDIDVLLDSPYIIIENNEIKPCHSNKLYINFSGIEYTEHRILSMLPEKSKKISSLEKLVIKLVNSLNNKHKKISGYVVAFNYENVVFDSTAINVYPVTNTACGGISYGCMKVIISFCEENGLDPYFTWRNHHNEQELYGTINPCVTIRK